jgi:predicted transcriptional regulator
MNLKEIVESLDLQVRTGADRLDQVVVRGYASDLMSDVMAHAEERDLWVTLQTHQNVVAVAVMKSLAGIILVNGREPQEDTLKKAEAESLPIMVTELPAFELIGRLYALGISGSS